MFAPVYVQIIIYNSSVSFHVTLHNFNSSCNAVNSPIEQSTEVQKANFKTCFKLCSCMNSGTAVEFGSLQCPWFCYTPTLISLDVSETAI